MVYQLKELTFQTEKKLKTNDDRRRETSAIFHPKAPVWLEMSTLLYFMISKHVSLVVFFSFLVMMTS